MENRFGGDDEDDSDKPIEKMKDSPKKFMKMKETLTTDYIDQSFAASDQNIPGNVKG